MIWLNGIIIAEPSALDIGIHRISRAERSASGRMSMEIVAIKRAITLTYKLIAEPALRLLLDALAARTFHSLRYPDPQGTTGEMTITVYVGDIKESVWRTVGGVRQWEEVTIGLIEQ